MYNCGFIIGDYIIYVVQIFVGYQEETGAQST
jgi:hypothetical protein